MSQLQRPCLLIKKCVSFAPFQGGQQPQFPAKQLAASAAAVPSQKRPPPSLPAQQPAALPAVVPSPQLLEAGFRPVFLTPTIFPRDTLLLSGRLEMSQLQRSSLCLKKRVSVRLPQAIICPIPGWTATPISCKAAGCFSCSRPAATISRSKIPAGNSLKFEFRYNGHV
jgi:hypothetical protein